MARRLFYPHMADRVEYKYVNIDGFKTHTPAWVFIMIERYWNAANKWFGY